MYALFEYFWKYINSLISVRIDSYPGYRHHLDGWAKRSEISDSEEKPERKSKRREEKRREERSKRSISH